MTNATNLIPSNNPHPAHPMLAPHISIFHPGPIPSTLFPRSEIAPSISHFPHTLIPTSQLPQNPILPLPHTSTYPNSNFLAREKKPIKIIDPNTGSQILGDNKLLNSGLSPIKDTKLSNQYPSSIHQNIDNGDAIREEFRKKVIGVAIPNSNEKVREEFRTKVYTAATPILQLESDFLIEDFSRIEEKSDINPLQKELINNDVEFTDTIDFSNSVVQIHSQKCLVENEVNLFTPNDNASKKYLSNSNDFPEVRDSLKISNLELTSNQLNEPSLNSLIPQSYDRNFLLLLQPKIDFPVPGSVMESLNDTGSFCINFTEPYMYQPSLAPQSKKKAVPFNSFMTTNIRQSSVLHNHINPIARQVFYFDQEDHGLSELTSILNRITPQNFDKLAPNAINLVSTSKTKEMLEKFIKCIFRKAINETLYCEFYAKLCNEMAKISVIDFSIVTDTDFEENDSKKHITFRRCLLTICQQEFEMDKKENDILQKMYQEHDECVDDYQKQILKEELELKEKEVHKHSLGNVRLIGELFRLNMLSENIIHECTVRLLKGRPNDDYLEALCWLFTVVGKDLDKPEAKLRTDQYFERISHLMKKGFMSVRVKYLLMNLLDLRKNGWQERRAKETPKTLDELHQIDQTQSLPSQFISSNNRSSSIKSHFSFSPRFHSELSTADESTRMPYYQKNFIPNLNSLKSKNQLKVLKPKYSDINENPFSLSSHPIVRSMNVDDSKIKLNPELNKIDTNNFDIGVPYKSVRKEVHKIDVSKKVLAILEEFNHLKDENEAIDNIQSLINFEPYSNIICDFFNTLNITGGRLKTSLSFLLNIMVEHNIFTFTHMKEGLVLILNKIFKEEIDEDCPLIFEFIANCISQLFVKFRFNLSFIYDSQEFVQGYESISSKFIYPLVSELLSLSFTTKDFQNLKFYLSCLEFNKFDVETLISSHPSWTNYLEYFTIEFFEEYSIEIKSLFQQSQYDLSELDSKLFNLDFMDKIVLIFRIILNASINNQSFDSDCFKSAFSVFFEYYKNQFQEIKHNNLYNLFKIATKSFSSQTSIISAHTGIINTILQSFLSLDFFESS